MLACSLSKINNALVGLARTIYIRFIYGIFGREIIKYTVIYGVDIRFWPTLCIGGAAHAFNAGTAYCWCHTQAAINHDTCMQRHTHA